LERDGQLLPTNNTKREQQHPILAIPTHKLRDAGTTGLCEAFLSEREKRNYAFGRVDQLAESSGFFCLEHNKTKDTTNIGVDGKIDCIPPSIALLCGCQLSFSLVVGAIFCIIRGEKNCDVVLVQEVLLVHKKK